MNRPAASLADRPASAVSTLCPSGRAPLHRSVPIACAALVLAALGSGCALISSPDAAPSEAPPDADFPRSRLVALDFVGAMAQLPELEPARTTLYTGIPASRFGEFLVGSLQQAGYDLRLGADAGAVTLGYRIEATVDAVANPGANAGSDAVTGAGPSGADDGALYTFLVNAGPVRLKRSYRVDLAGVRPATAMQLHGADARMLDSSSTAFAAPPRSSLPPEPASATRVTTHAVPRRVEPAALPAPVTARATASRTVEFRDDTARKRNLFETGRSNYADLLARYETLSREVMVFPNDSLHMGEANKRRARELAAAFDLERDVVSVLGCSHGPTALANGNETLANGRSYRVKEELMLAGIAASQVLEEGCWAGTAHDRLPGRGVVVTHMRLAAAG